MEYKYFGFLYNFWGIRISPKVVMHREFNSLTHMESLINSVYAQLTKRYGVPDRFIIRGDYLIEHEILVFMCVDVHNLNIELDVISPSNIEDKQVEKIVLKEIKRDKLGLGLRSYSHIKEKIVSFLSDVNYNLNTDLKLYK